MGRRVVAWIVDIVLYAGFALAVFAALAEYVDIPSSIPEFEACDILQDQDSAAASGCFELGDRVYLTSDSDNGIQFVAAMGYFAAFVILQGVTGWSPGKLVTGLRVVKEDGTRAGVGRSLVRTVLWVVDAAPWFLPLVGFITGLTTTGHRRVGDMVAKTYVVRRSSLGQPVAVGAAVAPPPGQPWGAMPPPPESGTTGPTGPPTASPPPAAQSAGAPPPPAPTTDPSGATPPPLPTDTATPWAAPSTDVGEAPSTPEIDEPVDVVAPELAPDDDWWSGPEANPAQDPAAPAPDDAPEPPTAPEVPAWGDPSQRVDESADEREEEDWKPPTTPMADMGTMDDPSPSAGPAPFAPPGGEVPAGPPIADPPPAGEGLGAPPTGSPATDPTAHLPPPQWDQVRNTYIQWDPRVQQWLEWEAAGNRWKPIDT